MGGSSAWFEFASVRANDSASCVARSSVPKSSQQSNFWHQVRSASSASFSVSSHVGRTK